MTRHRLLPSTDFAFVQAGDYPSISSRTFFWFLQRNLANLLRLFSNAEV